MSDKNMNMKVELKDNSPEVLAALQNAIGRALFAIGEEAETYAKETIKNSGRVDTGNLMNSINHQEGDDFVAVGTSVKYAIWHEVGTGIYAEDGNGRKSPWAFKDSKGEWHYTKGIKPLHFIQNSITEHTNRYKDLLRESLENA